MDFAFPQAFAALVALPFLIQRLRRRHRASGLPLPPLQYGGDPVSRRSARIAVSVSELLVALCLVIAVAQPCTESRFERLEDEGIDIVLVLDVSLSMLAEDFPPTRLAALKEIAQDFLNRSGGHRVGIVIFAGDTYVQSPLTNDRVALDSLLQGVSVHNLNQSAGGGTAIGDALLVAAQGLEKQKLEGRDQAVVLITDGESNLGFDPLLAARRLRQVGARLYAIGIGSNEPQQVYFMGERVGGDSPYLAVLDDRRLKELTTEAEGRYFRATDADALGQVFGELSRLESAPMSSRLIVRRRSLTHFFALAGFVVFAVGFALELLALGRPWR